MAFTHNPNLLVFNVPEWKCSGKGTFFHLRANECVITMLEFFGAARRSGGRSSFQKGKYDYTAHWTTPLISLQELWEVPWCQDPSEALVSVMSLRWQENLEATIAPLNWAFNHTVRILQGVLLRRNMWWRPVALWGRPVIFFQRTQTCFPECWRNQTRSSSIFAHSFCLYMLVCQAEKSSHMLFLSSFSQVCTTDK